MPRPIDRSAKTDVRQRRAFQALENATAARWRRFVIDYRDFDDAGTSQSIELMKLPRRTLIMAVMIAPLEAFSGTYGLEVGISGNTGKYASSYSVASAPGPAVFQLSNIMGMESLDDDTSILLTASSGSALSGATSGKALVAVLMSPITV